MNLQKKERGRFAAGRSTENSQGGVEGRLVRTVKLLGPGEYGSFDEGGVTSYEVVHVGVDRV